jgi:thiopeptide-type bacteriocin biosynthesis protein
MRNARENPTSGFRASGFFVLRSPLLAFDELTKWGEGLRSHTVFKQNGNPGEFEAAWAEDVQFLRNRLRQLLERPEIIHALFVASPSLQSGIEHWKRDPDSKKGLQAERALVRYFERMSTRSTPFGIFAGCSVGQVTCESPATSLNLRERTSYRTCTRLDFDYLFALTTALHRDPALVKELRYWPNSSLHRIADAWHYVESRLAGRERSYHLVKLSADEYLDRVLERAQSGMTFSELIETVLDQSTNSDISSEDAENYVKELVASQALVSTLAPLLTGQPPLDDLIDQLNVLPSTVQVSDAMQTVRSRLAALDAEAVGVSLDSYAEIVTNLSSLPAKFELEHLFQVDMIKPPDRAVLGQKVVEEFRKGIDLLCRVGDTSEPEELLSFREAFSNRYEYALVPILEALDEEMGIGYGRSATDCSPLLCRLNLGAAAGNGTPRFSPWHLFLLRNLVEHGGLSNGEIQLDPSDLPTLPGDYASRLPDAFHVTGILAASSAAALETGDFSLYWMGGAGPSGTRMFGRFCQADPELDKCVRDLLRDEESINPDAIYAEVVYLPEGRLGNVLCRPVLREYEIPYLGRSGAPLDRQIPLTDLLVGVAHGRITLYSRRMKCEVIPRLSNAHGFQNPALPPVYRFLCSLQHQGAKAVPGFSWGPLANLNFLPRVRAGRLVLSIARWQLNAKEINELGSLSNSPRFRAMQDLRQRRNLPRWVVLHEADNALVVDMNNPLSVDAFVHTLKRSSRATLTEMYPPPDLLCVTGPEGRFHHEINLPFVRRQVPQQTAGKKQMPPVRLAVERKFRTIGPGKEWLYIKLYGGNATLDEILVTAVLPLARRVHASGPHYRWFFVRYADPHAHLRLRFNGPSDWLQRELMPLIFHTFNPLLASGRLWKIQFDTYDREIERYGGLEAMSIAENIFFADSEAVLEILKCLQGDKGLDSRWRIALLGADRLLSDCGFDLNAKRRTMEQLRDSWHLEFKVTALTKKQLARRFRSERENLEALLGYSPQPSYELNLAEPILQSRSIRVVPEIHNLRALKEAGRLQTDIPDLVTSYVHMHINRLFHASPRVHEVVLYDFSFNLYDAMLARERKNGKLTEPTENHTIDDDETAGDLDPWAPAIPTGGGL